MAFLSVSGISKQEQDRWIVRNIHFTQQSGEKIAIAGETGSGKSSLMRMIGGLVQPTSGEMHFENRKLIGPLDQLLPGNPGIAYLGQHFELRNNYWVHEILEYANLLTAAEAQSLYEVCRISHLLHRRTNDGLSGGEKQRIALARLLTTRPRLLLLDEPFSNLDIIHKNIIRSVIADIGEKLQITCLMVSHDPLDILSWADTVILIKEGSIVQEGRPKQVYSQPANEYCAGLLGDHNLVNVSNQAFLKAFELEGVNGHQLMIRPEDIQINHPGNAQQKGVVQRVQYFGSFHLLEILVEDVLLRVRTHHVEYKTGDIVFLSILPGKAWGF